MENVVCVYDDDKGGERAFLKKIYVFDIFLNNFKI